MTVELQKFPSPKFGILRRMAHFEKEGPDSRPAADVSNRKEPNRRLHCKNRSEVGAIA